MEKSCHLFSSFDRIGFWIKVLKVRLILIAGATTTGKSDTSCKLCNLINQKNQNRDNSSNNTNYSCCIINCDSRQVYKGLDIGTGKIEGIHETRNGLDAYWYENCPHFLIDFIDPKINYSVADFQNDFEDLIKTFAEQTNPPKEIILSGGSAYFINQILSPTTPKILPKFQQDYLNFKKQLEIHSLEDLKEQYNLVKDRELNNSDYNNKIRLINYLTLHHSKINNYLEEKSNDYLKYFEKITIFEIKKDNEELKKDIIFRTTMRFKKGLIKEVKEYMYLGERLSELGLEYAIIYDYLNSNSRKIKDESELVDVLIKANIKLSKKQNTWLKKFDSIKVENFEQIMSYLDRD